MQSEPLVSWAERERWRRRAIMSMLFNVALVLEVVLLVTGGRCQ